MFLPDYEKILTSLIKAKVKFLVVGGIAMNAHGLARSTFDLDLVVFLKKENILRFSRIMKKLGYESKIPVNPDDFADEQIRKKWIEDKNMVVFSYRHQKNMMDVVDVFVDHPFPFDEMWREGKVIRFSGHALRIAGLKHLMKMKQKASRPKDEMDIRYLGSILRKRKKD